MVDSLGAVAAGVDGAFIVNSMPNDSAMSATIYWSMIVTPKSSEASAVKHREFDFYYFYT